MTVEIQLRFQTQNLSEFFLKEEEGFGGLGETNIGKCMRGFLLLCSKLEGVKKKKRKEKRERVKVIRKKGKEN